MIAVIATREDAIKILRAPHIATVSAMATFCCGAAAIATTIITKLLQHN